MEITKETSTVKVKQLHDQAKWATLEWSLDDWHEFKSKVLNTTTAVIFKEKNGDQLFLVNTWSQKAAAALRIVQERKDNLWYPEIREEPGEPQDKPSDLSDPSLVGYCKRLWKEYRSDLTQWRDECRQIRLLNLALEKRDGVAAWQLLYARKDYEYEDFEIVELVDAST